MATFWELRFGSARWFHELGMCFCWNQVWPRYVQPWHGCCKCIKKNRGFWLRVRLFNVQQWKQPLQHISLKAMEEKMGNDFHPRFLSPGHLEPCCGDVAGLAFVTKSSCRRICPAQQGSPVPGNDRQRCQCAEPPTDSARVLLRMIRRTLNMRLEHVSNCSFAYLTQHFISLFLDLGYLDHFSFPHLRKAQRFSNLWQRLWWGSEYESIVQVQPGTASTSTTRLPGHKIIMWFLSITSVQQVVLPTSYVQSHDHDCAFNRTTLCVSWYHPDEKFERQTVHVQ